jgi:putative addiction module component (TIGR02574 family)
MGDAAQDLWAAALALPERQRLELASELVASVDEPEDEGWQDAWLEELERREEAVWQGGPKGSEWSEVRTRVLAGLRAG